jgi:hypothetical protein
LWHFRGRGAGDGRAVSKSGQKEIRSVGYVRVLIGLVLITIIKEIKT